MGSIALSKNTTASNNLAIGYGSLSLNTTGGDNTAVGANSLANNTTGNFNTVLGNDAMNLNTIGQQNVAIGKIALRANTTGNYNNALGYAALVLNTTGVQNSAFGTSAMYNNSTGSENVGVGHNALAGNKTGTQNVAIGVNSMNPPNTTAGSGNFNVALGYGVLNKNLGGYNVAVSHISQGNSTTGGANISVGQNTLGALTTGANNIAIGHNALLAIVTGTGNVAVGHLAGSTETGSNKLYIENSNSTTPLIGGDFNTNRVGINRLITSITNTFEVGGEASKATAGSWLANSDSRLKKNIKSIKPEDALSKILQMKGVQFEWNDTVTGTPRPSGTQIGFIAQDIQKLFPEKVKNDNQGYLQTAYGDYDPLVVQAIKALHNENESLKNELLNLKKLVEQINNIQSASLTK